MPTSRLVIKQEVEAYAATLFGAAYKEGGEPAVLEVRAQMEEVLSLLRRDLEFGVGVCDPADADVMVVMVEREEVELLGGVFDAFEKEMVSQLNLCVVEVTTYVPLDDNLRQIIIEKAEADLGRRVVLREHIDQSILGGIIMSTGGKRIDASVSSQLNKARQVLKETSDGGEC